MHLILSAFGSYGDVLPMVGIGATARRRGHRVQLIANPYFRSVVEEAGLELLPLGTAQEYLELTQHPDLWHARRGLKLVITRGAVRFLRNVYALVAANYHAEETVLGSHGLDLASRVFHDKHGAPLATIHYAPMAMMSVHETCRYIGAPNMTRMPRWMKRMVFWLGDRLITDPLVLPELNRLRSEHGLAPVDRVFTRWNHSPTKVLGLFPEWFAARQPDWPAAFTQMGFPLWDPVVAELEGEVEDFLSDGDAPIVFAPGSANVQADDFFRTAVEVCQHVGRRGVLMTKYVDQLPKSLPAGVRHFRFVPFSKLLPRAAALVHHGGIGTCAQGLACALPQVVMPMAYDQLDNGARLARLGVGAVIPVKVFNAARVATALKTLLNSSEVHARCKELAKKCDGPTALEATCEQLESLHARRKAISPQAMRGGKLPA